MSNTTNCHYDYAHKCDCSEDDKCGCDYPNNLPHDFNLNCLSTQETIELATNAPMVTSAFDNLNQSQQTNNIYPFSLLGNLTPDFTAPAILGNNTLLEHFNLYKYTQNKNAILFFYPEDFSFTCPSELLMLNDTLQLLTTHNTTVLAISTDSVYSHLTWKELSIQKDGIPDINFPLIADLDKKITNLYGILTPKKTALRATFIIDRSHIIRHISLQDAKIHRNPQEFIRIIDILNQKNDNITACPSGWKQNFPFERPEQQNIINVLNSQ